MEGKETSSVCIPSHVAALLKTNILKTAEGRYDVKVALDYDRDADSTTRLSVLSDRPIDIYRAERYLLDQLAATQKCTECVYGDGVFLLTDDWSAGELLDFEKAGRVSIVSVDSADADRFLLLKGWDKASVAASRELLLEQAREYMERRDADIHDSSGDEESRDGSVSFIELSSDMDETDMEMEEVGNQLSALMDPLTEQDSDRGADSDETTRSSPAVDGENSDVIDSSDDDVDLNAEEPSEGEEAVLHQTKNVRSEGTVISGRGDVNNRAEEVIPGSDEEEDTVEPEQKKYPKCMNILVLGETGVGKSTFINGLVNYLKYDSMDDALKGGVDILIKSAFTLTDDDYFTRDIVTEPTILEEQGSRQNEMFGKGQSATQDPKSYVFRWGERGEEKSIRIIDTPGIGDTRGLEQDKKNFEKILSFIADFSEIHAICILIKPNTARLTLAFRFCIDELLVHLHKSASQNIVFCFTNTRGTLYKPGDTLPTLREHLSKLEVDRGVHIPLNKSTLFSFDNESFRFLCAMKEDFPFSKTEKQNFDASWTKSVEESLRLFSRVAELPVHNVNDTLCLNNTRSVIITLARPLAEIARNQMINMRLIEDKMKEVEQYAKDGTNLRNHLYVDQVVIHAEELPYPQTVCTAAKCVDHKRFTAEPNSPMQTVYKTICHDNCYVPGVQVENCPNHQLQECEAIDPQTIMCTVCGCIWSTHMHIRYKLNESLQRIMDPTVEQSIRNKDDLLHTTKLFLDNEKKKVAQLKVESDKITSYCAEFAAFLSTNSILPYNDSYRQYIEHLIREETEKVAAGGSDDLLLKMTAYKEEYEQQIRVLDESMAGLSVSYRSVDEMNEMVKELRELEHCGSVLKEINKLEMRSVRQSQLHQDRQISLNEGWFGCSGQKGKNQRRNRRRKDKKKGLWGYFF